MSYPLTTFEAINDERMSDDAYAAETEIMQAYFRAEAAFLDAVMRVNKASTFATIDAAALEDFAHDYLPDPDSWKETLEDAYRG